MIETGAGGRYTNMTYQSTHPLSTFKKSHRRVTRSLVKLELDLKSVVTTSSSHGAPPRPPQLARRVRREAAAAGGAGRCAEPPTLAAGGGDGRRRPVAAEEHAASSTLEHVRPSTSKRPSAWPSGSHRLMAAATQRWSCPR